MSVKARRHNFSKHEIWDKVELSLLDACQGAARLVKQRMQAKPPRSIVETTYVPIEKREGTNHQETETNPGPMSTHERHKAHFEEQTDVL
jgi:hypothetical protein